MSDQVFLPVIGPSFRLQIFTDGTMITESDGEVTEHPAPEGREFLQSVLPAWAVDALDELGQQP